MNYIIRDNTRKYECLEHIKKLPDMPLMIVHIKEYKQNRTSAQNNTFHMWCDLIAKETGNTLETIKDELKLAVLGTQQRVVKDVTLTEIRSSSKLDKKEFNNLMAATEVLARSLEIILPYPDDLKSSMREKS